MITRPREYLQTDGMPPTEMLKSVLSEHLGDLPRLTKLSRYYRGENDILNRKRSDGLPNNRMSHAYARYIVSVTSGYLIGKPVSYSTENSETLDEVLDIFKRNAISSVDAENARNAAIYGRGIEYVHVDGDGLPKATALSPEDAFVVYDDTCDVLPMFGVYLIHKVKADGSADGYRVWAMGEAKIAEYRCEQLNSDTYDLIEENVHYFGGVPLVEYWNDENEMGDFEWVIPQIDGYDKLESDRLNDKEQFVDALLLLTGCVMDKDERGREPWKQLREDKALCLPDSTASATYLHNSMDENGNQIFRDNIVEDIHKLSMVPDLSDRNFAANASGVAMKYKLLGLEQLTRIKEQWFTEGLKARLKLFLNFLALRGFPTLDISDVRIELSRSLPANLTEIAENIRVADDAGAVSTETKVRMFHAGDDWTEQDIQDEIDRIQGEKNTADPMMQMGNVLFGDTSEQLDEQDEQDDREEQIEG